MSTSIRNTASTGSTAYVDREVGKRKRGEIDENASSFPRGTYNMTIQSSRERPYIEWLASGSKTAEGRVNTKYFQRLRLDDTICFFNKRHFVLCKVTYLHTYRSFREMLESEGVRNMLPFTSSITEGVKVYEGFPGSDRVRQCGCVAIGVTPLESNVSSRHEL